MQNDLVRKGLVFAILIVLTAMNIIPMAGSLSIQKQVSTEKRLADCSIVGDSALSLVTIKVISEMGENGWYRSNIPIIITNKSDEIASIYYVINGDKSKYTGPFNITEDGDDIQFKWYAVDHEGNRSEWDGPFYFDLDQTKPMVPEVITYEAFQVDGKWYVTFSVTCTDATSGMDRVEWSLNDELQYTVTGSGPIYTWTIEWQNWSYPTFKATAYDKAGNSDYATVTIYPLIYPPNGLESSQFSTSIIKEDSHQRSQSGGIEKELLSEKPKSDCSMEDNFDIVSLILVVNRKMLNPDWIDGDVNITFIPDSDITEIYCKLDDAEWILYTEPLVFSEDGFHTFWWYIIDDEGHTSFPDSIVFKIDQTLPEINLIKKRIAIDEVKFIADVNDDTSGVDRVEFCEDNNLEFTDYDFPYEWTYTGFRNAKVTATVYDNAGHSNSSSMNTWSSYSTQQSSSITSSQNTMCMIPSTESIVVEERVLTKEQICKSNLVDDTTPPVTTISFNPPRPDGKNGWYVSNVTVMLNATDDSGVKVTYYRIDGGEWKTYEFPFIISEDGINILIEYYSIDNAGNIEDVKTSYLNIDQTPPVINFSWEVYRIGCKWYLEFHANATDETSGMDRVEFALNGVVQYVVTGSGPVYGWVIELFKGFKSCIFGCIFYDKAGNKVIESVNGSDIKSYSGGQSSSQQSSNNQNLLGNLLLQQMVKKSK